MNLRKKTTPEMAENEMEVQQNSPRMERHPVACRELSKARTLKNRQKKTVKEREGERY